jgi:hypothetical protein
MEKFNNNIALNSSRFFLKLFFSIYSVLIISFVYANIPKAIILFFIIIFMMSFARIYYLQSCWKNIQYKITDKNSEWKICDKSSNRYNVTLQPGSYCSTVMIILNFKMEKTDKNLSLLVFRDMLSPKDFKQLKIFLINS